MMDSTAVAKKSSVLLQNEITPRARRCGMKPYDFCPPVVAAALTRWELDGEFTRRDTRRFLDLVLEARNSQ